MLFNSYIFICGYLPITLLGFFSLAKRSETLAAGWLTAASLVFYAWWSPGYVALLMGSILFNYLFGLRISRAFESGNVRATQATLLAGVTANLLLLIYYKYTQLLVNTVNDLFGTGYQVDSILLPIGISFFTFTQIAFLVDASKGLAREYRFIHYCLFVTYFPHLIAGPVLHHKEMMPQFSHKATYRLNDYKLAQGLTLFVLGLSKKLLLADNLSIYATPVFDAAAAGSSIGFLEAWGGSLSYTLQIYFDFSGYTDMAIGLSLMFGVRLPINFFSPYKSTSIIEFWRRWHMTLSRFLRDYLYIPLGGNRKGKPRRTLNLLITMLLGGLWHGANWTFLVWGGLHGVYLIINHTWQGLLTRLGWTSRPVAAYRLLAGALTFTAVVVAWVFFRAESIPAASRIIDGMLGRNGLAVPFKWIDDQSPLVRWLMEHGATPSNNTLFAAGAELRMIALGLAICWLLPNTVEVCLENPAREPRWWSWTTSKPWAAVTVVLGFISFLSISGLSEFIYFQF